MNYPYYGSMIKHSFVHDSRDYDEDDNSYDYDDWDYVYSYDEE